MALQTKISYTPYKEHDFSHLKNLNGISDKTLELHLGLYAGYVKNTNILNEKVIELTEQGKSGTPEYAELKRRYGFEYDGMRLHEYYFENMKSGGQSDMVKDSTALGKKITEVYGSIETWKKDFMNVGNMRGVGWAILFQDRNTKTLTNNWVTLHQDGVLAGFEPILVMDVWEHAWLLDYKPSERMKYIEAFFSNINWEAAEHRLVK